MAKLTAQEVFDALDDAAIDAEIEAALAKTPEEHRRELAAEGFDLDEVDAKADALFASLKTAEPSTPGAPVVSAGLAVSGPVVSAAPVVSNATTNVAKRKLPRVAILAPVALALAAGVLLWANYARTPDVLTPPPETPAQRAGDLRDVAKANCKVQQWDLCLKELDEARTLDPQGEQNPDIAELRREAEGHR